MSVKLDVLCLIFVFLISVQPKDKVCIACCIGNKKYITLKSVFHFRSVNSTAYVSFFLQCHHCIWKIPSQKYKYITIRYMKRNFSFSLSVVPKWSLRQWWNGWHTKAAFSIKKNFLLVITLLTCETKQKEYVPSNISI